ncbi:hypothetical protein K466DRAFT_592436 [Polyporus arcularius HHB13444]|uniref:Uncharacterized protein n=1 Tax=Polyporus arcularius HHB13444 TaxID=1314778 RepID=A0A5C3NNY0_9APHY|nr:hypothetical protein K466DRAFT_592436 [Polyporus arcularius HHB13444]
MHVAQLLSGLDRRSASLPPVRRLASCARPPLTRPPHSAAHWRASSMGNPVPHLSPPLSVRPTPLAVDASAYTRSAHSRVHSRAIASSLCAASPSANTRCPCPRRRRASLASRYYLLHTETRLGLTSRSPARSHRLQQTRRGPSTLADRIDYPISDAIPPAAAGRISPEPCTNPPTRPCVFTLSGLSGECGRHTGASSHRQPAPTGRVYEYGGHGGQRVLATIVDAALTPNAVVRPG